MINTIIALLVEFGLVPPEDAEELAKKIRQGTLPYDYETCAKQVRTWLKEIKDKK